MANSNYPFGTPLTGTSALDVGFPLKNGKYLFVDATTGSDGAQGLTADTAFRTITTAITFASSGDTIFIAPGTYDENVVITKDYITLIGMQVSGYAKPDIAPTTGIAISAGTVQGFVMKHIRAVSADADTVVINGNGWIIEDCVLDGDAGQAATEACLRLVGDAADDSYTASEGKLINSLIRGSTSGAGIIFQHAAAPSGVGVSDVEISGCRFYANGVDLLSAVNSSGGGAGIFTNLSLHNNQFLTVGAAYVYMDMDQGAAGDLAANSCLMSNNCFADEALIAAQIDISGQPNCMFVGNYDCAGLVNGSTFNN